MTVLGAGLLWFGWFGFNAGSALAASGLAASAFIATNTAAAAATITWVGASYIRTRKVSVVGAAAGAVAGLVAITPASGFVTPGGALVIGLAAGGLCYSATLLRERAPRSTTRSTSSRSTASAASSAPSRPASSRRRAIQAAYSGLIDGNPQQVITQIVAVGATVAFAAVAHVRHRQARRCGPRASGSRPRRGARASTWPSTARSPTRLILRPHPPVLGPATGSSRTPGLPPAAGPGFRFVGTEPQPSRTPDGRSSAPRAAAHATPPAARALGSHHGSGSGPSTPNAQGGHRIDIPRL